MEKKLQRSLEEIEREKKVLIDKCWIGWNACHVFRLIYEITKTQGKKRVAWFHDCYGETMPQRPSNDSVLFIAFSSTFYLIKLHCLALIRLIDNDIGEKKKLQLFHFADVEKSSDWQEQKQKQKQKKRHRIHCQAMISDNDVWQHNSRRLHEPLWQAFCYVRNHTLAHGR